MLDWIITAVFEFIGYIFIELIFKGTLMIIYQTYQGVVWFFRTIFRWFKKSSYGE